VHFFCFFLCLIIKIFGVHFSSIFVVFLFFVYIFLHFLLPPIEIYQISR
jgi:hypothetical protein